MRSRRRGDASSRAPTALRRRGRRRPRPGKVHAAAIGHYDWTGSARATWTLAYVLLLAVAAYGAGLPDLPRSWRAAIAPSVGAAAGGALAVSAVQLVVGDELLPRFVVFGSAVLLVRLVPALRGAGPGRPGARRAPRPRARGRLAGRDGGPAPRARQLARAPGGRRLRRWLRPRRRATALGRARCSSVDRGPRHGGRPRPGRGRRSQRRVPGRRAARGRASASARCRSSTRSGWASCRCRSWSGLSLFFDIGELHRARYGRVKRLFDVAVGLAGLVALLGASLPFVAARQPGRQPRARCSTASRGSARTTAPSRSSSSGRCAPARPACWPTSGRPRTTPASRRSAGCCAAPTSTSCPRWSTSSGATCPSSAPAPSSPTTSRS